MQDWIPLDPVTLNPGEKEVVHGVEINVGLSPYDVPDGVRGYYDDDIKRFVIEFRYLDDEEDREPSWQNENITLVVGEHTGCLYQIHVNVDDLSANAVKLKLWVADAIRDLTQDKEFSARRGHYDVANDVVSENADALLEGV